MVNVLVLMLLAMTIFALLGMQLMGGQLGETRYHFDYFGPALISVFVLLTGNWYNPMMDAVERLGPQLVAYYVGVVTVGSYLIMNLFLVVLLQLFTVPDVTEAEGEHKSSQTAANIESDDAILINARRAAQLREFSSLRRISRHVSRN